MNERIEKLARLAGGKSTYGTLGGPIVPPPPGWFDHKTVNLEKFAELIVKECAEVAVFKDDGNVFSTADVAGARAAGRVIAANLIQKHFGVE